ncbi:MAG: putative inner rane efflux protein [Myxococcaceae bacterium]|nr:putative inner rane efflux protein [Myxococcaceae bacterium]
MGANANGRALADRPAGSRARDFTEARSSRTVGSSMTMPAHLSVRFGLIAGQICLHASMAGLRMAAPLELLSHGEGEALLGPLLALFQVGPVLLALPAGRMADQRGYHVPVRIAVALTLTGGLAALASTRAGAASYLCLCLAALLSGAGTNIGLITIQRTAGRTAHDRSELRRVYGLLGIAPSLSNFLGPLVAGVLIDQVGFWAAYVFLAALPLLSLACAPLVPADVKGPPVADGERRTAWDLFATPMLRRLFVINWFMSTSWDVHAFVVPVLGHERGLSASAIGSVLGLFALAVTTVRLVIPALAKRLSEAQVLSSAMLVVAVVFAIYPSTRTVWQMGACAIVLGLSLGSSQPMVMAALHQITPAHRQGEALALRSMTMSFSSALMPLGFGLASGALGAAGLFWLMSGVVGAGMFVARSLSPTHAAGMDG